MFRMPCGTPSAQRLLVRVRVPPGRPRPFDLTGKPVKGTADPTDAPTIARGQYLDTIGAGDGRWYKVKRTATNSTIHVGVTHRATDTGNLGEQAYVGVYAGPDEDRCDYETSFARGNIAYTSASSWKSSTDDTCNTAKTVWVNVKQYSSQRDFTGAPVEIAVYEEPPLGDSTGAELPGTTPPPTWATLSPSTANLDVGAEKVLEHRLEVRRVRGPLCSHCQVHVSGVIVVGLISFDLGLDGGRHEGALAHFDAEGCELEGVQGGVAGLVVGLGYDVAHPYDGEAAGGAGMPVLWVQVHLDEQVAIRFGDAHGVADFSIVLA